VQTKPVPRGGGVAQASGYQVFVKANFQRIRKENAGASLGVVMEMLGKLYREEKARNIDSSRGDGTEQGQETALDKVIHGLDVISLED